jgi:hypothetical protein
LTSERCILIYGARLWVDSSLQLINEVLRIFAAVAEDLIYSILHVSLVVSKHTIQGIPRPRLTKHRLESRQGFLIRNRHLSFSDVAVLEILNNCKCDRGKFYDTIVDVHDEEF